MLGLGVRIKPRFSGVDEAQLFAQRVTAAGGTLTTTEQSALSTLVSDLKNYGIWNKMHAIYPFVGASKNLFSYTEDFTQWSSFNNITVTKNVTTAPDGTTTANKVNKSGAQFTAASVWWGGDNFLEAGNNTFSLYVKNINCDGVELRMERAGNTKNVRFIFASKTFTGSTTGASFEELADGWFRLSVTTSVATWWIPDFNLYSELPGAELYVWGAQLEKGTVATTYQKVAGNRTTMAGAACIQNLVSNNFTGTFSSGWRFAKEGILPNGSSTYMDTGYNPSVSGNANSGHLSVYSRTNILEDTCDIGCYDGTNEQVILGNYTGLGMVSVWGQYNGGSGGSDSSGLLITNRQNSSNIQSWRNTTKLRDAAQTPGLANKNLFIGAQNYNAIINRYSTRQYAIATIGSGLTDTETTNFYTAIQKFESTLGREIGTPVFADADVIAFTSRVTTAGGSLSDTERTAAQQLVIQLKENNLWTKMHAMYPMLGASAAACAQNLKSSSYTGSFTAGMTYAAGGITGNGTSAYMDTNFAASSGFSSFNNGASIYSRTNVSDSSYDYGYTRSSVGHNVYLNYSSVGMRWQLQCVFADRPSITPSGTDSSGFFTGVTGASNDRRMYKNSALLASNTSTSTSSLANDTLLLGAQRAEGTPSNFSVRQYAFFALHTNLTAREVNLLATIHRTFQNILGRW